LAVQFFGSTLAAAPPFAGNLTAKMTAMFAKMAGLSTQAFGKGEVALGFVVKLDNATVTALAAIMLSAPGSFGAALARISHTNGASGLRISESCCAATTLRRFEERPDADRM
jgi:hypothetical protein